MKQKINRTKGFSIIEMTLASFLVLSVAAVSYRVLNSQTSKQVAEIQNQKADSVSQLAISRFKADASMIDPNWVRYGVAPIWPHQGYGLGQNFYLLSTEDRKLEPEVNDGVTFLRRVPQSDRLYVPVGDYSRLCSNGSPISSDKPLYNTDLTLDSVDGLNVGDWLLLYQAGHYALGVIASVNSEATSVSNVAASTSGAEPSASTPTNGPENTNGTQTPSGLPTSNIDDTSRYTMDSGGLVSTSYGSIRLRMPNAQEKQLTSTTTTGMSNGFVTKPGVVAASFDITAIATPEQEDDFYCFDSINSNFQKVAPVSYYIDYRTSNGGTKTVTNSYMKDKSSNENIKMLVRSEYINGVEKREYLAPIDDLGFTYDLVNRTGTGDKIARDVGREKNTGYLQNLNVYDPTTQVSNFLTSYQIVAMKMSVGFMTKDKTNPSDDWRQSREVKVALDPSLQNDAYRSDMTIVSSLTDNLNMLARTATGNGSSGGNEQIGKPLYLNYGSSSNSEVVVPASTFQSTNEGLMDLSSKGALYVYNPQGCAVNPTNGCDPSANHSAITFNLGTDKRFFPNTVAQVTLDNGDRRIIVGGVAMTNKDDSGRAVVSRVPGIGVITLHPGETLASKLASSGGTPTCSISGCEWHQIDNVTDTANYALVDTAHIATDPSHTDTIYVATMTKQSGEASTSSVYKGIWNGTSYNYSRFAGVVGTEDGKIISAISDHPIKVGNETYLAVCLTKKMSSSCGGECVSGVIPEEINPNDPAPPNLGGGAGGSGGTPGRGNDAGGSSGGVTNSNTLADTLGEIQLVRQGSGALSPGITLIRHNYRCSAINEDLNGNLIVSGRLTVQPIPYAAVKKAVEYSAIPAASDKQQLLLTNNVLYLDEAVSVENAQTIYADYYQVDPSTYEDPRGDTQYIGWLTGTSTVEFADGTFGMVNGNKYRVATDLNEAKEVVKATEYSNAGISKIELAGMNDRVVATIQTDPNNINNSIISATYAKRSNELPSVYIPGSFMVDSVHIRATPTPLPSVTPSMSEQSWFLLYQALLTPINEQGLNSAMPILTKNYVNLSSHCKQTHPKTCS